MIVRLVVRVVCVIGMAAALFLPAIGSELSVEQRFRQLSAIEAAGLHDLPADHARALDAYYRQALHGMRDQADSVSDADLVLLHRAAWLTAFYGHRDDVLDDLRAYLKALESRNLANESAYYETYAALVSARRFDEARALQASHPMRDAPPLPRIVDASSGAGSSELVVTGPDVLTHRNVALDDAFAIVVIAHPGCHFTQNAADDIERDPELHEMLARYGKWIAPQDQTVRFQPFIDWGSKHPDLPINIAYRQAQFPLFDKWGTPTFYFMRAGKVMATVVGWPKEGRKAELMAAFKRAMSSR